LVLRELVALDDLVPRDDLFVLRAPELLLDAITALLVQHVEGELLGVGGDVEPDGNGDEPEADRPRADRSRGHGFLRRPGKRTPPGRVKPVSPYETVRRSWRRVYASIVMRQPLASRTTSAT